MSTASSRALAAHLERVGARMYGAFWCSHCAEQKAAFGAGAALPYVECFPEGYRKGVQMAPACKAAKLDGFPTWQLPDGTKARPIYREPPQLISSHLIPVRSWKATRRCRSLRS